MESRLIWAVNDTEIKTIFLKGVDLLGGWKRRARFETDAEFWPKEVCSLFSNSKHLIAEIYAERHFFAEEVTRKTLQVHTWIPGGYVDTKTQVNFLVGKVYLSEMKTSMFL